MAQAPAPERPIAGGLATPALLAQVLISKYCDHTPLYRQAQIFARHGVELERSTLAGWVGGACWWLEALDDRLRKDVFASDHLFADDTPIQDLDPGPRADQDRATRRRIGRHFVEEVGHWHIEHLGKLVEPARADAVGAAPVLLGSVGRSGLLRPRPLFGSYRVGCDAGVSLLPEAPAAVGAALLLLRVAFWRMGLDFIICCSVTGRRLSAPNHACKPDLLKQRCASFHCED